MNLLDRLNLQQRKGVEAQGPVMIIAGPGTGKTQTLIAKIEYLISHKNISSDDILALTFTKKAAAEMRERLSHISKLPVITTFHGFAYNFLITDQNINLISEREREDFLYSSIEKLTKKSPTKKQIKDFSLEISQHKAEGKTESTNTLLQIYNEFLRQEHKMDFDDLLTLLGTKLKDGTSRFQYVLVDEFQDTNILQYKLIKQLLQSDNIFVIGDPYQSIYSFRGADGGIFERFKTDFPTHTYINLVLNYRLGKQILDASSSLFSEKRNLKGAEMNGEVVLIKTANEYTEADFIVNKIFELVGGADLLQSNSMDRSQEKYHFSEIAVIYRTHSLKKYIEKKLHDSGIPYQIIGEDSPYEKPEIVFIIDVLKFIQQKKPDMLLSLLRSPVLHLSRKSIQIILKILKESIQIKDISHIFQEQYAIGKKDINTILTFLELIEGFSSRSKTHELKHVVHILLTKDIFKKYIESKQNSQQYINQFLSVTEQFKTIEECLCYTKYLEEHEFYDPRSEKVTLMTMHASKGLEFKNVFICGYEDGFIPMNREDSDIEEEKRLLYVALTRAKNNLFITYTEERNKNKSVKSTFYTLMKHFITEQEDPANERYKKKKEKWMQKKSQMKLF